MNNFEPSQAMILGLILFALSLLYLIWFSIKHGKGVLEGLKGRNGKWDPPEVVVLLWVILFPIMVLADVFLHYEASDNVWYSMDLILLFALSGRVALDWIGIKENNKKSENNE